MPDTALSPAPEARAGFPIEEALCEIVSNDAVNAEYRLMIARAPEAALRARAGQFFHLLCPATEAGQPFLRRPMSIYRIDRARGEIGFLYKVTGKGTRGLATLRPGETLNALGPLGRGFTLPQGTRHVMILGRGVGLATMAPLARLAAESGAAVTAVLSARSPELVMSRAELAAAGARVIEVVDTDGSSAPEEMEPHLTALHDERAFDYIATCGSNRLFRLARGLARSWGITGEIALEQHMGCGLGMCYACVIPVALPGGGEEYRRVCWDGPVFTLEEAMGW
ncbi:dihydroorotate dehydrogenase electron transfer subunit (plasmid) [Paroceanicella profunda]|uniref:Dihydroorotate dehydrogenase electron transfer subunit n=1 Tax=Paroceanicella profunda TaxID=2579971 RepID=A0A5B8G5A7_9RHOB|nr:dihydroorotate dehydrogenase electron transfer subunit [Paroceanicella profunda]QDL94669.1 dihydroorotate dehydrogenase electron transfer subunit [Paroceanicella profunda]